MKKTIALLLTLLLCVCSLSALADDVRAVRPIRLRTDMNALAGLTLTAIPGAYDPKTNTLELTLLEPEAFSAEDIRSLRLGEYLISDRVTYQVNELEFDDMGCTINESNGIFCDGWLWLYLHEDGLYYSTNVHDAVWREVGTAAFPLSPTAVFLDGIDPRDGAVLDTPTQHSIPQFLAMKADEEENDGVGFSCHNFRITFDENGQIAILERHYVSWQ
ncbi:MAG: hypothetical protein J6K72_05055 [Clostridia bacterium]|nr:hypothetical protein [Clostridia bacterium]